MNVQFAFINIGNTVTAAILNKQIIFASTPAYGKINVSLKLSVVDAEAWRISTKIIQKKRKRAQLVYTKRLMELQYF